MAKRSCRDAHPGVPEGRAGGPSRTCCHPGRQLGRPGSRTGWGTWAEGEDRCPEGPVPRDQPSPSVPWAAGNTPPSPGQVSLALRTLLQIPQSERPPGSPAKAQATFAPKAGCRCHITPQSCPLSPAWVLPQMSGLQVGLGPSHAEVPRAPWCPQHMLKSSAQRGAAGELRVGVCPPWFPLRPPRMQQTRGKSQTPEPLPHIPDVAHVCGGPGRWLAYPTECQRGWAHRGWWRRDRPGNPEGQKACRSQLRGDRGKLTARRGSG